jgi:predicted N-acyltransferase
VTKTPASDSNTLTITVSDGFADIDRAAWDSIANPDGQAFDPFLSWDFLQALEETSCVSDRTGWSPRHLLVHNEAGSLIGAAPLYLKTHSQGEYIFDHSWADALERAGGRYYPKLLCAVPFTPVPGRRLLTANGPNAEAVRAALAAGLAQIAERNQISGAHINFLTEAEQVPLTETGWLPRLDVQFHFTNKGYASFADFLAELSSDKRKNLRKERAKAQEGVEIVRLSGDQLTDEHWDAFFACYIDTGSRKWGRPYLNRAFFALIHERMADKVVLILAREPGGPWIAAALNFIGSEAIYGRHWGRLEDRPFLHFELCYYQAVDEAIARGLPRVEAGAQGGHKLARGYGPVTTRSSHYLVDEGFRSAVARYLKQERNAVERQAAELEGYTPFRKEG